MNTSFAFDTSALVSLGHTGLIDAICDHFKIIVSNKIISELHDIGKGHDEDARAANNWLKMKDRLLIKKTKKKEKGEDELYDICRKDNIFLISDDVKAVKRFDGDIKWYFSVHIIYILYKKQIITKQRAITSIEKMRTARDWRNNIIYVTGTILFD